MRDFIIKAKNTNEAIITRYLNGSHQAIVVNAVFFVYEIIDLGYLLFVLYYFFCFFCAANYSGDSSKFFFHTYCHSGQKGMIRHRFMKCGIENYPLLVVVGFIFTLPITEFIYSRRYK